MAAELRVGVYVAARLRRNAAALKPGADSGNDGAAAVNRVIQVTNLDAGGGVVQWCGCRGPRPMTRSTLSERGAFRLQNFPWSRYRLLWPPNRSTSHERTALAGHSNIRSISRPRH